MKKIVYILGIAFIALSCSNEENSINNIPENNSKNALNSNGVISFQDYYEFIQANSNDKILVQNIKYINSTGAIQSLVATRNNNNDPYLIKLNNNQFTPYYIYNSNSLSSYNLSDNSLINFYGKKLKLNFDGDTSLILDESDNYNIYIPNVLDVTISNLSSTGQLVVGTQISWNSDGLNTNGVTLLAEYSPNNQSNQSIPLSYPYALSGGKTIEDTGRYIIQKEDLEGLPKNSNITFTIGRAGFMITNNGDIKKDLSFGVYTMVKGEYIIN